MPTGTVMTIEFALDGQEFVALNRGPLFKFTEAISFIINCDTQEEIDHYWNGLIADGGKEINCGWLKDKFGVTWQVIRGMDDHVLRGAMIKAYGDGEVISKEAAEATSKMIDVLNMLYCIEQEDLVGISNFLKRIKSKILMQ